MAAAWLFHRYSQTASLCSMPGVAGLPCSRNLDLAGLAGVPGGEAGVQQDDVAGRVLDTGLAAGQFQAGHADGGAAAGIVGLPGLPHRPLDVEQDRAPGQAVPGPVVDGVPGARQHLLLGDAVVHLVRRVADVGQRVPLAGGLRVEVVVDVVEAGRAGLVQDVVARRAAERRQRRGYAAERHVQAEDLAPPDQPGGRRDPLRRHQVDQAEVVPRAEQAPPGATAVRGGRQVGIVRQLGHRAPFPGFLMDLRSADSARASLGC